MSFVFNTANPYDLFASWLKDAEGKEISDPWAMSLATVNAQGKPSVRIVLMRGVTSDGGFSFFTNYDSPKADDIAANSHGAICFHWKSLTRQVRADGAIRKASAAESDAYFKQRHTDSKLGAWASAQSAPLDSRDTLLKKVEEYRQKFGEDVPRPPNWGGYVLMPDKIEFWQQGDFRLHERELFTRHGGGWAAQRLNP